MLLAPASPWCGQGDREVGGNYHREVCGCVVCVCVCVGGDDHHIIIIIIPNELREADGVLSLALFHGRKKQVGLALYRL